MLISGEAVAGNGSPLEVENPYTEETVASVGTADPEQLDAAFAAAREASREWARTPAVDRGELLREVATRLRARTGELAEVMTLEGGKPLVENSDEVSWTAACFDYYAEIGRDSAGRVIPSIESSQLSLVVKEPLGVIGCIVPWNYPLLLLAWKMAPALAAGNTLVCKPSELTPLSTLMLAPCLDHLPAGVVNLVAGGPEVGARDRLRAPGGRCRLHRLGRDREEGRAGLHRPHGPRQPGDGRQGPVHRLLGRRGPDRRRRQGRRLGCVPELRAGLHQRGALLRDGGRLRRLPERVRRLHEEPRDRRPDAERHRHRADDLRRPSGGRSPRRSRPPSAPAPRSSSAAIPQARSAGTSSLRRWSPGRRPRPIC